MFDQVFPFCKVFVALSAVVVIVSALLVTPEIFLGLEPLVASLAGHWVLVSFAFPGVRFGMFRFVYSCHGRCVCV
jgi:hypothetical protein